MTSSGTPAWHSLDGWWDFEVVTDPETFDGETFSSKILVPFPPESLLSGIGCRDFMPRVAYRRVFQAPEGVLSGDKRVFLRFLGVDYEATPRINRYPLQPHKGAYGPFTREITGLLRSGDNSLVVDVRDDPADPSQPAGKQSDRLEPYKCVYGRSTGIWRSVGLEVVPRDFVSSFRFLPDAKRGRVTILVRLGGDPSGLTVRASVRLHGRAVGVLERAASERMELSMPLEERDPWEPGNPSLYDVELLLHDHGEERDRVVTYFGLRDISVRDGLFLLNGRPTYQRLVLDQGYHPDGMYTPPSDEAIRSEIENAMAMGFNGARFHQQSPHPRYLYWADRLGFLVWAEYGSWGLDHSRIDATETVIREYAEIVTANINSPSIVAWVPLNETDVDQQPDMQERLYRAIKTLDSTRPVIPVDGFTQSCPPDLFTIHNYGEPELLRERYADLDSWRRISAGARYYHSQPFLLSEFGGRRFVGGAEGWGYGTDFDSAAEFLRHYSELMDAVIDLPLAGYCYTQLTDTAQERNGLYDEHRRPKVNPALIREINCRPLRSGHAYASVLTELSTTAST